MKWRAISGSVLWPGLGRAASPRGRISDAPDKARRALCRGRADRRARPPGRRISRPRPEAAGVSRTRPARRARSAPKRWRAPSPTATRCSYGGIDLVLNPMLYKKLPYDPVKDFRMLALVTDLPVVMEIHPSVPAKTVAEFVAYAKQNPGKLNFGSAGTGGTIHLAGEMFKQMAGVDLVHVPTRAPDRRLPSVVRQHPGDVRHVGTALPPVKAGCCGRSGVSSKQRSPDLPDVPTIAESGYPDYASSSGTA